MRNIKITIAYNGTNYQGWQVQKKGNTVQAEVERAVKKVFGENHTVYGASRTDSGVHSKGQTANFKISSNIPLGRISLALNSALPYDIAITRAEEMNKDFHSRFDARSKLYKYIILNSTNRDPFEENFSWRVPYKLNLSLMRREAENLIGKHDFKSFQASDNRERSSVRTILDITIKKQKKKIIIEISGDGFLYNMVRNITGTLIDIGRGYLPEGSMKKILAKKDRKIAGQTAPAKGLFLMEVLY